MRPPTFFVPAIVGVLSLGASQNPSSPTGALQVIVVNPTPADCYAGPGCLDERFGERGKARPNVGSSADVVGKSNIAKAIAMQPDGKIVVAGTTRELGADPSKERQVWVIARLQFNGELDRSFGTDGITTTDFKTSGFPDPRAIAVLADGRILIAGSAGGPTPSEYLGAVVRLDSAGRLDTTFGIDGKVTADSDGFSLSPISFMKVQPDGKILLIANESGSSSSVSRLESSGAFDRSFGADGTRLVSSGSPSVVFDANFVDLQADGRVIVGGAVRNASNDFALCRLTPSGAFDPSFGRGGRATLDFLGAADSASTIVVAPDDSILVAGTAQLPTAPGTSPVLASKTTNLAFARFDSNGVLSTSFGTGGKVVLDMHGGLESVAAIVLQPDGKLVFAGTEFPATPTGTGYVIVGRLTPSGSLDRAFGSDGITETRFGDYSNGSWALALDPNGTILVAGSSSLTGNLPDRAKQATTWALARYFR